VGKLFGNNSGNDSKTEIVLSITPRILRPPAMLDATVRTVFSGTESGMRERAIQLDPIGAVQGQSVGGTAPAAAPAPRPPARPLLPLRGNVPSINPNRPGEVSPTPAPPDASASAPAAQVPQPPAEEPKAPQ